MITPMELLEFDYINPIKCIYHRPIGRKDVVPHWHEAIEICYVAKGNPGTISIEDKEYQLEEGDIFVINSRLIHSFQSVITPDQRVVTLLINYDWLRHCLPKVIKNETFELIKTPKKDDQVTAFKELTEMINRIKDLNQKSNSEDNYLQQISTSVELIGLLVKKFTVNKVIEPEIPDVIAKIIEDFHDHYRTEIQLSAVAKKYNYSYAYFSKMFKKYLGVSPKRYLTLLRLQNASELIAITDDKLAQIANDTGFPDEKSFYCAFKDRYGQTPLEYRKCIRTIS